MKLNKEDRGITLVALIVTIIILLILAGISIAQLTGNGLFNRTKQAQKSYEISKLEEELRMKVYEVQMQKNGMATMEDLVEYFDKDTEIVYEIQLGKIATVNGGIPNLEGYETMIVSYKGYNFEIDSSLNITYVGENDNNEIELNYTVKGRVDNNVNILITIKNKTNGIKEIINPIGTIIDAYGKKNVSIDYSVELGKQYKFEIVPSNGETVEKIIQIDKYYHNISKNFDEGIEINNEIDKTEYNKSYSAILNATGDYILESIIVKMDGKQIVTDGTNTVDITTGKIEIANVIGDINITAISKKLEILTTETYINTTPNATSTITTTVNKGTTLYIAFNATLEGKECTIEPSLATGITKNGIYKYVLTGTYNGKIIKETKEVKVTQFESPQGVVQYDAGEWTKEDIDELKALGLYNINVNRSVGTDQSLNFTFGGFTYKGDIEHQNEINSGSIVTSRNQSVSPQSDYGVPKFEGWQILEIKDEER